MSQHTTENFTCPDCQATLTASSEHIGCNVRCSHCESKFVLQELHRTPAEPVAPVINPAPAHTPPPQLASAKKKSSLPLLLLFVPLAAAGYWYFTQSQPTPTDAQAPDMVNAEEPLATNDQTEPYISNVPKVDFSGQSIAQLKVELFASFPELPAGKSFEKKANAALKDQTYLRNLTLFTFINKCGADYLSELQKREQGKEFINALFNNQKWQEQLMVSGPFTKPEKTVHFLYLIWKHDRKEIQKPLYQKLATSVALEHAERGASDYHVVQRYLSYRKAHQELKLHAGFDSLDTWEMRFAIEMDGDEKHFDFLLNKYHYQTNTYTGTCWECAYELNNMFGDSIHGRDYYRPWQHAYNKAESSKKVGGVCGTLSHYGASAARVHGIPAMAAGQPSHCAYIIRENNKWIVTYSVTWPTYPKNSFWSGSYTYLALAEDTFKSPRKNLASFQAAWLAESYRTTATISPKTCAVYPDKKWRKLPDLSQHEPTKTVLVNNFDYRKAASRKDWITVSYQGEITIPKEGNYSISLSADDDARLAISTASNGKDLAITPSTSTHPLAAGTHAFTLDYLEAAGGDHLRLSINATEFDPRLLAGYKLATDKSPLNYTLWLDYRDLLLRSQAPAKERLEFCTKAASSLVQHQEAAWRLISEPALFEGLSSDQRLNALVELHGILQQTKVEHFVDYPFDDPLNKHHKILGSDKQLSLQFFKKVLKTHENSQRYFLRTLDWGSAKFAKDKDTSSAFNQVIAELASGSASADRFKNVIKKSILEAEKNGDKESFHSLANSAEKVFKLDVDTPLSPFEDLKPFPGYLLSKKGIIKLSSTSKHDDVFAHRGITGNLKRGGFFHTGKENNPSVTVELEGKGALSGITIVNRDEYQKRQVPLLVEISTDGKKWTKVFSTTKPAPYWNINLRGKNKTARYVRASVKHPDGKKEFFHLRGIFVYGKKLF